MRSLIRVVTAATLVVSGCVGPTGSLLGADTADTLTRGPKADVARGRKPAPADGFVLAGKLPRLDASTGKMATKQVIDLIADPVMVTVPPVAVQLAVSLGLATTWEALAGFFSQWWVQVFCAPLTAYYFSLLDVPGHFSPNGPDGAGGFSTLSTARTVDIKPNADGSWEGEVPNQKGPIKIRIMLPGDKSFEMRFASKAGPQRWVNVKGGQSLDLGEMTLDKANGLNAAINPLDEVDTDDDGTPDGQDVKYKGPKWKDDSDKPAAGDLGI